MIITKDCLDYSLGNFVFEPFFFFFFFSLFIFSFYLNCCD